MIFVAQRESIGGEDVPRPRMFEMPDGATLGEALAHLNKARYLPPLTGTRGTWSVDGERPLAVVAQEYRDPWPLVPLAVPLAEIAGRLPRPHLSFRFYGRRSPEEVFRELGGDPVRLPREAWEASTDISWSEAFRRFFDAR